MAGRVALRALYDYNPQQQDELPLREGELVYGLTKDKDDWWTGINASGRQGVFPGNYVEAVSQQTTVVTRQPAQAPFQANPMTNGGARNGGRGGAPGGRGGPTASNGLTKRMGGGGAGGAGGAGMPSQPPPGRKGGGAGGGRGGGGGGKGGGGDKKKARAPRAPDTLKFAVWGYNLANGTALMMMIMGTMSMIWGGSEFALNPTFNRTFGGSTDTFVGLGYLIGGVLVIVYEYFYGLFRPQEPSQIPTEGIVYIMLGIPGFLSLPCTIPATGLLLTGAAFMRATYMGEKGDKTRLKYNLNTILSFTFNYEIDWEGKRTSEGGDSNFISKLIEDYANLGELFVLSAYYTANIVLFILRYKEVADALAIARDEGVVTMSDSAPWAKGFGQV